MSISAVQSEQILLCSLSVIDRLGSERTFLSFSLQVLLIFPVALLVHMSCAGGFWEQRLYPSPSESLLSQRRRTKLTRSNLIQCAVGNQSHSADTFPSCYIFLFSNRCRQILHKQTSQSSHVCVVGAVCLIFGYPFTSTAFVSGSAIESKCRRCDYNRIDMFMYVCMFIHALFILTGHFNRSIHASDQPIKLQHSA